MTCETSKYYRLKMVVVSNPVALRWIKTAQKVHPRNLLTTLDATGYHDNHCLIFVILLTARQRRIIEDELKTDREVIDYEFRHNGKIC